MPTDLAIEIGAKLEKLMKELAKAETETKKTGKVMANNLGTRTTASINQADKAMRGFTWNARGYLKDTSRVITGILISQGFYNLIRAIKDATKEMWNFHQEVEQAELAFAALLGGEQIAAGFMRDLEDLVAVTPFTFEGAVLGAKRLKAMGFASKNILPVIEIMSDAASATGATTQQINRLILALGQIRTKGKLAGQEIRQIAEANIPIYDILTEKLGMSLEEIEKNVIPANVAIQAILEGMNDRYAGMARIMANSTRGLMTTIKDNILFIGKDVLDKFLTSISGGLLTIRDRLNELRKISRDKGLAGLFQALVPEHLQRNIIIIISAFKALLSNIKKLGAALEPLGAVLKETFINVMTVVVPALNKFIELLTRLTTRLFGTEHRVRTLLTVLVGMGIVWKLIPAIIAFARAIRVMIAAAAGANLALALMGSRFASTLLFLQKNIWVILVTVVAGAFIYLAMQIKTVVVWFDALWARIASFLGIDFAMPEVADIEPPDFDWEAAADALAATEAGLEDVGDAAEDAADKFKKFLMPFDEVYNIPEKLDKVNLSDSLDFGGALDLSFLDLSDMDFGGENLGVDIANAFEDVSEPLFESWSDFWGAWADVWIGWWESIKDLGIWDWFKAIPDWNVWKAEWWIGIWRKIQDWGIWKWFKNIPNWKVWGWFKAIPDWNVWKAEWWIGIWRKIQDWGIWQWFKDIENWAIWQWFEDIGNWNVWDTEWWIGVWKKIEEWGIWLWFKNIENWDIWQWFKDIEDWDIWEGKWLDNFATKFHEVWAQIATWFKTPINMIIDIFNLLLWGMEAAINGIIGAVNSLGTIRNPITGTEYTIGQMRPVTMPRIPKLAHGGIVTKDQVIRAGEGNVPEAIIPLTEAGLRPFVSAIADAMGASQGNQADTGYVAVPIDRKGLVDLERQLFVIRKKEGTRGSVGYVPAN